MIKESLRKKVLERANGHCERCGKLPDWRGLACHHIEHRKMGGSKRLDTEDNLIALCGKCHSAEHGIKEA